MKKDINYNRIAIRTRFGVWLFIAIALCAALVAVLQRGGAVEWLVLTLALSIVIISALAPLLGVLGLEVKRAVHYKMTQSGGAIEAELTIRHRFGMPLVWAAVGESITNSSTATPSGLQFRALVASLRRGEQRVAYTWKKLDRGSYHYEPLSIAVGDWLGLTAYKKQIVLEDTFIVLPAQLKDIDKLRRLSLKLASRQENSQQHEALGQIKKAQRSKNGQLKAVEAKTLQQQTGQGPQSRPYREGDSFMHLDHRALARGQGLHTKINDYEQPVVKLRILDNCYSRTVKSDPLDRLFNLSIGWLLYEIEQTAIALEHQLVYLEQGAYLLADIHSEKYEHQLAALQQSLAAAAPKPSAAMLDTSRLAAISAASIDVFTTNWRQGSRWLELAEQLKKQGKRLALHIVVNGAVLSYQMREQQKLWEAENISLIWLHAANETNDKADMHVNTGGAQQYGYG